jgi:hypothetical protein
LGEDVNKKLCVEFGDLAIRGDRKQLVGEIHRDPEMPAERSVR